MKLARGISGDFASRQNTKSTVFLDLSPQYTMSALSPEDEDGDLYGDLVGEGSGDTVLRTQNAALKERVRALDLELKKLAKRVSDSDETNAALRAENETLERNISCLYRTALAVGQCNVVHVTPRRNTQHNLTR
jgi:hypothetical protein|tara:strand:+ start:4198 stop:4599 length:402 start_codon:yes stop_codon:yes gene_type:complete